MEARGHRKLREGKVCSAANDKTIAVLIERRVRHPLLGKEIRMQKKVHAHDENNEAQVGNVVRIMETRPVSRLKRWRLVEILSK
jgi:small subunit ribosomal protein S17